MEKMVEAIKKLEQALKDSAAHAAEMMLKFSGPKWDDAPVEPEHNPTDEKRELWERKNLPFGM